MDQRRFQAGRWSGARGAVQLIYSMAQLTTLSLSPIKPLGFLSPSIQLVTSVRYSRKHIPIKDYRDPSYDKKLLLAACEPVKKIERRPRWVTCKGPVVYPTLLNSVNVHPYYHILAQELKAKLEPAQFILFYHVNNNLKDDKMNNRNAIIKAGFSYEYQHPLVYRFAVEDTKFRSLLPFLTSVRSNLLAISNEIDFKKFLEAEKKLVNCILLFAYVYGRLVSKAELMKLTKMPGIKETRGQLLSTLSTPSATLASTLNYQLSLLSNGLNARIEQLKSASDPPKSEGKE